MLSDIKQFQEIMCSAGFSIEFGISYIKQLFSSCARLMDQYLNFLDRNIRRLKKLAEGYLNTIIDWGVLD